MGQEVSCETQFGDRTATGKALFETDEILFRGGFRLKIPLHSISAVEAVDGVLRLSWPEGTAALKLGPHAAKWAEKIRNPRTLADKLGIKPGMRVALCGMQDRDFRSQVAARTSDIIEDKLSKESDLIFLAAEKEKDLARLARMESSLKRDGAVWVIYPKGVKTITEASVRAAGLAASLVDVKVARFSATHTALKFVIPLSRR